MLRTAQCTKLIATIGKGSKDILANHEKFSPPAGETLLLTNYAPFLEGTGSYPSFGSRRYLGLGMPYFCTEYYVCVRVQVTYAYS